MDATPSIMKDGLPLMFFRRSQDHFTSLASTGEPSENFAAGSRWKVNSVWSALLSHFSASSGTIVWLSLSRSTSRS